MNFKTKSDAVTTLRWTREVAAIGGAVTGITVMWGMIYFNVVDTTGSKLVGTLAALVGISVGLFIIDFSYRRNFPYVTDLIVSGQAFKSWRIFLFTMLLLMLSVAQIASSGFLSWEGRKDVAEGIIKAPELQDVASIKVASDKTTSAKIREVKAQIASLDRAIRRKEKEVEKSHPTYTDKIKSGADKWGWYANQLEKKKAQSVGTLRQEKSDLSKALSELVGNQAQADKLVVESIAMQNQAKMEQYSSKKARNMNFLGYFGVGCLAIVAFITIMLSLIGYSDTEEMDMKSTRQPFRANTIQAQPPQHAPGAIPVRSSNQFDSYEIARRQQMAEARIEEMGRQQEERIRQIEARREEEARQAAERIRQERERAAKIIEQQLKMQHSPRQLDNPQPLSDKGPSDLSKKLSAKVTDKGISVEGVTYGVSELSKLKDKSQKWYKRQFTSATPEGREANKERWDAIKPVWEKIGATLKYDGQRVSIEGGTLKT